MPAVPYSPSCWDPTVPYGPSCWDSRYSTDLVLLSWRLGSKFYMPCCALGHAKKSCSSPHNKDTAPSPTSNCASIVGYVGNPESQRTASCFVVREALEAASRLPRTEFQHIGSYCNRLAHKLAQLATKLNHSVVWRNWCPATVEHLVAHDVNTHVIQ